ncbi:hypothetical protein A2U01_0039142, partial [Trifolium medium]|nr:hypothetical protein [Trifolium medium]
EVIEDKCKVQSPSLPVERVVVNSIDAQEAEWNREIEIFLQQLEDDIEETPKVVEKPSELKELPPNWKYVFLGEEFKKPIVISSMLTPLEEEELLREAKVVNDGFGENLNGMIPIYCMHTPKMNKDRNPVDQSQEVLIPNAQVLMKDESMKLDATDNMNVTSDNSWTDSVHVISKTKKPKKPPKRSIKEKRFKWKFKKEKPKGDPEDMCSWLVGSKVAPLKR